MDPIVSTPDDETFSSGDRFLFNPGFGADHIVSAHALDIYLGPGIDPADVEFSVYSARSYRWHDYVGTQYFGFVFHHGEDSIKFTYNVNFGELFPEMDDVQTFGRMDRVRFHFDNGETVRFGNTPLTFKGTGVDQEIYGSYASDTLIGTAADETLGGLSGADVYVFDRDFGHDRIGGYAYDAYAYSYVVPMYEPGDVIRFAPGIAASEVGIRFEGRGYDGQIDLVLTLGESQLDILGWSRAMGVKLEFADGTVLDYSTDFLRFVGAAGDTVVGTGGDDVFESSTASETLNGERGADVYRFSGAFGHDIVRERPFLSNDPDAGERPAETIVLEFGPGIAPHSLIHRSAGDALVIVSGTNSVTVADFFSSDYPTIAAFADGTRIHLENNRGIVIAREATAGVDHLQGRPGYVETFDGGAGNDRFVGGDAQDTLRGGLGDDTLKGAGQLHGGDGNDWLLGSGDATVLGETGNDTLSGSGGTLSGGIGDDVLNAYTHPTTLNGGLGDDTLKGGTLLYGGAGDDVLSSLPLSKRVVMDGGDGDDHLLGTGVLAGGAGADTVRGFRHDDTIRGDDGRDDLGGQAGDDVLDGGTGADVAAGGEGADTLFGRRGDDTLNGNRGADSLSGGNDDDRLDGGDGADRLAGDDGDDRIIGGDGRDVARGDGGADTLSGGRDADRLEGGTGDDTLLGQDGADTLVGGRGADRLEGGAGDDDLTGGKGADVFRFVGPSDRDVVSDFGDGDRLDLSWFRSLQPSEPLRLDDFRLVATGEGAVITLDLDSDGRTDRIDIDRDGRFDDVRIVVEGLRPADLDRGDFVL